MGLLLLVTLAYLPLSTAVVLDLIAPARRVFSGGDEAETSDPEACCQARRKMAWGVCLIAGLTVIQCAVFAYAMHELGMTIGNLCPGALLA